MKILFFIMVLFAILGVWTFSDLSTTEMAHPKPNIVLIFVDDMGYGDVSALNPDSKTPTPHIDHLGNKGIVFRNAHASASVCTPSRYGLLTGRYAWRSKSGGQVGNGFAKPVIEAGRETLATVLKNDGYTTACIGKWHLGLEWQTKEGLGKAAIDSETGYSNVDFTKPVNQGPNDYGFDYSFILPASLDMPPYVFLRDHQAIDPKVVLTTDIYPQRLENTEYHWDRKHTKEGDVYWDKMVWWRRGEISQSFRIENCLSDIVNEGISFMGNHVSQQENPFFLYLPLTGPHSPWMPTDEFKIKSPIGTYGDFILTIDHMVGQVTETLVKLGIEENTIIIFTSDNGAYWPQSEVELHGYEANWGRRGQKGDIWDGGHRIPLIISWPSHLRQALVYDHLVSLTDIYKTLVDLTGLEKSPNSGEDSQSFLSLLYGNTEQKTREAMVHQSSGGMYGIQSGEWKLAQGLGSGGFSQPVRLEAEKGGPVGQLYHLKTDSLESKNVYLQYPEIVKKLQKELASQIDKNN